jgi:hypothetical protein
MHWCLLMLKAINNCAYKSQNVIHFYKQTALNTSVEKLPVEQLRTHIQHVEDNYLGYHL